MRKHSLRELKRVLSYNSETGVFTWLHDRCNGAIRAGDIAGCVMKTNGYKNIVYQKRSYLEHRLAWFFTYADWPEEQIDHRDRNKINNRSKNLREASISQNAMHRKSKSKHKCIFLHKGKFKVEMRIDGVLTFFGYHKTLLTAVRLRNKIFRETRGEFA